jgi:hypothetical protein
MFLYAWSKQTIFISELRDVDVTKRMMDKIMLIPLACCTNAPQERLGRERKHRII